MKSLLMLKSVLKAGIGFIYPPICLHCGKRRDENQEFLCFTCWNQIKSYDPSLDIRQVLKSRMIGRVKTEHHFTLFWYQHSSPLKTLFQSLKYQNRKGIGLYLGRFLGKRINETLESEPEPAILVPVPVHKLKQIDRGYNQAQMIAMGIAMETRHVILPTRDIILKIRQTDSQTKKDRVSRWTCQKEVFGLNPDVTLDLNNRSVLLVDDIITTGATLEQIGKLILSKWPEARISIATIALTE